MASYPGSRFRTPLREVRRCFSQAARTTTPGAADCQARSPPGLSGLAAETLLTPGRRNDPCGTRPPSSPLLWAGRPLTSSDRRDPPAPSPAISRTTRTPSPSEHHALDTLPPCPPPPPEHRAPTAREKPLTPDQPSSLAEEWSCGNQTRAYQTHHASTTHAPRNPADTGERPGGPPDPRPGTGGPPHPAHLTASTPISVSRRFALQSH